jgi:hydrogenase nickel incorporation protein HypA/HybF
MHELSIAASIVELVERHAGGRRVRSVELKVGALRQVVPDSLAFAFELVTRDTPLAGARLEIEPVPASARCESCEAETVLVSFPWRCARCGGCELELRSGEELMIESLELEQEAELPCTG